MRPDTIARRYARALFKLAEEEGSVEPMGAALGLVAELFADPDVDRALTGPAERERKTGWLGEIAERTLAPDTLRSFLQVLAERDRLAHLGTIRTVFDALVDAKNGVTRATVRSATELGEDVVGEITRVFGPLTGKTVIANVEVEAALIAGVIVEVDGKVYDGSLRTQLAKLHGQMAG